MSDQTITSPARITEVVKGDLFGDVGAERFDEALDALHLFAQATGCPAGGSVIAWFAEKDREAQDEFRARYEAAKARAQSEARV
ncbi:MAG: hypothetical protein DI624_04175 [Brevundimonas sp.]|uniref:hypothetical protein n=1 Tax=Brevundimonas sp. TaxID=1871086 RepID=UPI000DB7928E|nr:hypothetical protein [Brevundimonas sp.]PZT99876.1 MAG: hypothetical protein DI624_04175 [Brevundimonas sp.]